ncbi:MAG: AAA family ATPase [bacterium]|nr:AAA family ATPase [bacterium]
MEKEFNVTGSCNPQYHYMADTSGKIGEISELIEKNKYFTINRPRQYGKSSCLDSIEKHLTAGDYFVISTTFESMSDIDFKNEKNFIREFFRQLKRVFKLKNHTELIEFIEKHKNSETFGQLDDVIGDLVEIIGKPTVLLIDEVDKCSDNQLFLSFLGLIRSKYLLRYKHPTFQSVVTYMNTKYIVELKKWYSEEYHKKGIAQLADYLESQGQKRGYLLVFDFRSRKKVLKQELIRVGNKEIFAVWV